MVKRNTQGFPKTHRLTYPSQFKNAYENGIKINAKYFVLYALENDLPHARLGMTVSRKIGKSVIRNRVKRLIREVFRKNQHIFKNHYDLVVNAKKSLAFITYGDMEKEFYAAIDKLQIK